MEFVARVLYDAVRLWKSAAHCEVTVVSHTVLSEVCVDRLNQEPYCLVSVTFYPCAAIAMRAACNTHKRTGCFCLFFRSPVTSGR